MVHRELKVHGKWIMKETKKPPALFYSHRDLSPPMSTLMVGGVEGESDKRCVCVDEVVAASNKKPGKTIVLPVVVPSIGMSRTLSPDGVAE